LEQRLKQLKDEEDAVSQRQDYEAVARLKTEISRLEQQYNKAKSDWQEREKISNVVDEKAIAELAEIASVPGLDLIRQNDVEELFKTEKPEVVIVAAAKVGGIHRRHHPQRGRRLDSLCRLALQNSSDQALQRGLPCICRCHRRPGNGPDHLVQR
jgi:hypothetical protein